MRKYLCLLVAVVLSMPATALGAAASLMEVPTNWRLENYMGDSVVAWYTGAVCDNGSQLHFGANATIEDRNRFWSLVMTAKVSNKKVFVYYESTTCDMISFSLPEGQ